MQFRKKPVVIEAARVSDLLRDAKTGWKKLPAWIKRAYDRGEVVFGAQDVHIHTLEGKMLGGVADWIICGVKGELYPCKPEIFEATYDPVGEVAGAFDSMIPAFAAAERKTLEAMKKVEGATPAEAMAAGEALGREIFGLPYVPDRFPQCDATDRHAQGCVCGKIRRGEPPYINRATPVEIGEADAWEMNASLPRRDGAWVCEVQGHRNVVPKGKLCHACSRGETEARSDARREPYKRHGVVHVPPEAAGTLTKIELHPAYAWDCQTCGLRNYESAIRQELTDEDKAEMREDLGLAPGEEGEWLAAPVLVQCAKCSTAFGTKVDDLPEDEMSTEELHGGPLA